MTSRLLMFPAMIISLIGLSVSIDHQCPSNSTVYQIEPLTYSSPLTGFYRFATLFLRSLSPSEFPPLEATQKAVSFLEHASETSLTFGNVWHTIAPLIKNQSIFIFLLVLGFGFACLTPLIGCICCWCRCIYQKCGGKRYQKNPKNLHCTLLTVSSIVCVIFLSAGLAIYIVNTYVTAKKVPKVVETFFNETDLAIEYSRSALNSTSCKAASHLNVSLQNVSEKIQKVPVYITHQVHKLLNVTAEETTLSAGFEKVVKKFLLLKDNWYTMYNFAMLNPQFETGNIEMHLIGFNKSIDGSLDTSTYTSIQKELNEFKREIHHLSESFENIYKENWVVNYKVSTLFSNYEHIIQDPLKIFFSDPAVAKLQVLSGDFSEATATVETGLSAISNISKVLNSSLIKLITNPDGPYAWLEHTALLLILPIVLVILLTVAGLSCGVFHYDKNVKPYQRSKMSNLGGNLLIISVALLFIFSWILMLVCMMIFSVSYIGEQFLCQPMFNNPDYHMPLFLEMLPNITVQIKDDETLSIEPKILLNSCQTENSTFTPIYGQLNFDEEIDRLKISLNEFDFDKWILWDQMKTILQKNERAWDNNLELLTTHVKYMAYKYRDHHPHKLLLNQAYKVIVFLHLMPNTSSTTADAKASWIEVMEKYVQDIQNLHKIIDKGAEIGDETVAEIDRFRDELKRTMVKARNNVDLLSANLKDQVHFIAKPLFDNLQIEMAEILAKDNFTCYPFYALYKNFGLLFCKDILYPLHGLWLSVGWCLFFFIPAILVNIKLASYFRKMQEKFYLVHNLGANGVEKWSINLKSVTRKND